MLRLARLVGTFHIPGIAVHALGPHKISLRRKNRLQFGIDRAVDWVSIAWPHITVNAIGICHDEIIEHVLCARGTGKSLCGRTPAQTESGREKENSFHRGTPGNRSRLFEYSALNWRGNAKKARKIVAQNKALSPGIFKKILLRIAPSKADEDFEPGPA